MFNNNNGYSLSDIAAATGNGNDGFFGGNNGWWVILLFLFAFGGWGNNGWNNGNNGTANDVSYNFDIHDLDDGIRGLTASTANGFYNTNNSMLTGFANTQSQLCNTGFDVIQAINQNTLAGLQNTNALTAQLAQHSADEQLCCCRTQNQIDSNFANLNYNLATQECDTRRAAQDIGREIIDNQNNNHRQMMDFMVQSQMSSLLAENQALKGQISQSEQNAYLINALRPSAEPAYLVANPYTGTYGTYGYNAMFGGPLSNGFGPGPF